MGPIRWKDAGKAARTASLLLLAMTLLCGVVYTGLVTGIARVAFPRQAEGDASLIGQTFTDPKYLIGRPSGGPTNLSPVSEEFRALVAEREAWWRALDPDNAAPIPEDLLTASASGVDPNISPAAAEWQVSRIARIRGMTEEAVRAVIARFTTGRFLGFVGEPAVNVLKVNEALDGLI